MSEGRFHRTELLIGAAGVERLRAASVAVVGLGAVGGYATEALARSGVGRLRLVDFDSVEESNVNRQLVALSSTLGMPKTEVAAARVRDINPDCVVETLQVFVDASTIAPILAGPPDLVVDAIDTLASKVELIAACTAAGVRICSSMGAAVRRDPSRVRAARLSASTGCPLARKMRRELRRRGLPDDVPCVYSDEPTDRLLVRQALDSAPSPDSEGGERRHKTLPSLAAVTGIFGLTIASMAIEILLADREASGGGRSHVPS